MNSPRRPIPSVQRSSAHLLMMTLIMTLRALLQLPANAVHGLLVRLVCMKQESTKSERYGQHQVGIPARLINVFANQTISSSNNFKYVLKFRI